MPSISLLFSPISPKSDLADRSALTSTPLALQQPPGDRSGATVLARAPIERSASIASALQHRGTAASTALRRQLLVGWGDCRSEANMRG